MKPYFSLTASILLIVHPLSAQTPAATPPSPAVPTPPAATAATDPSVLAAGKSVYAAVCIVCHQPTGLGLAPVYPPLKDSDWVSAPKPGRLVRIVLHGVNGPLTVNGKPYNMLMPPHGPQLNDGQIAAVLTYIRQEYGNKASPVSTEYVAAARAAFKDRAAPWTETELKAVPDK